MYLSIYLCDAFDAFDAFSTLDLFRLVILLIFFPKKISSVSVSIFSLTLTNSLSTYNIQRISIVFICRVGIVAET